VYPIFDLGSQTESMQLIFETFAKHAGFTGKLQLVGAGGDKFAQAMSTSTNNDSSRAKILLGWQPTRASLVGGMGVYAKAMLASSL
jgi:nucleoside-diphosphate-sugar epimerase